METLKINGKEYYLSFNGVLIGPITPIEYTKDTPVNTELTINFNKLCVAVRNRIGPLTESSKLLNKDIN